MTKVARNRVVWWGTDPPSDIERELENRGLELVASEELEAILDAEMRAVIIPFQARKGASAIMGRVRRLRQAVVDRGGSIFIVTFASHDHAAAVKQTSEMPETSVLDGRAASKVAQQCAWVIPGPAVGDVEITLAGKTKPLSPQDTLLLSRAFDEYKTIEVQALTGGLSGASIWRIRATSPDGRHTTPFLVKADVSGEITAEIETMRRFVLDHMPFTNRPELIAERCVNGLARRLLVSRFVERAVRLDEYLANGRSATKVIRSIFDGPLHQWRSNATATPIKLGLDYVRRVRGVGGKHREMLKQCHELAKVADASVVSPEAVLEWIEGFPERTTKTCQAHGDMHPRNIFVRDNSEEIILIDFAHAGDLGNPILRDAATLDVALAFDGWEERETRVSEVEIERLYTPSLFGLDSRV